MKPMRLCGLWRARMVPVMALAIGLWFVPGEAVTQQPESKDTEKPSQYKPKDKPPPPLPATEMRVFQVKHANARDLARTIEGIWKQRLGPWLSVSVDERSNSVIVMATAPD